METRTPVAVFPFRGTNRQLVLCSDGTVWEHVERDNKVTVIQHPAATIPQPTATDK